jgi:hypothetical protein
MARQRFSFDSLRTFGKGFVGSAAFAAVTATVAALVGLVGSVYQTEIAASFPITLARSFTGHALVFWLSLASLAWLVYLRQRVDDEARGELVKTTRAAEQTSRRIEEFVQTLPPRSFQAQLANAIVDVHNLVSAAMPRTRDAVTDSDALIQVIRAVLHSLVSLALQYDDQPLVDGRPAVYSANVMLFVPNGRPTTDVRISFFPPTYDRARLRGLLQVRADLSATTNSGDEHRPDEAVPQINLPVPLAADSNGRAAALPGAPYAFLSRQSAGYRDSLTLPEWCRTQGDFPPSVQDELTEYFSRGPGKAVRSFVSTPLRDELGVLNLHANRPDLLGPRLEKRETFQALVTPLLQDLEDALVELLKLEAMPLSVSSDDGKIRTGGKA